jgi:hypothetical protein
MRRIFTSIVITAAFVVASFNSFGQDCAFSTTNPNPTPAFTATQNVTSGSFSSTNQTTIGTFRNGQNDDLSSPIYYYNSSQNTIYFKYHLASASNPNATINGYTITIVYGAANLTISCSGGAIGTISTTGADYYFSISNISFPASTNFRIKLNLDVAGGGSNRSVVATSFQANGQVASSGATLPVKFSNFEATPSNNSVSLKWMVAAEDNMNGYAIEKSTDGRNFSSIGFVSANGQSNYSFVDGKPSSTTYYRVKSLDVDGRYNYSTVALVKSGKSLIVLKAFPSPVISNLTIQHATATAGSNITISAEDGRVVKSVIPTTGTQQTEINLSSVRAGLYLVRYINADGEMETLKILKK